jgi:hypothetical protein
MTKITMTLLIISILLLINDFNYNIMFKKVRMSSHIIHLYMCQSQVNSGEDGLVGSNKRNIIPVRRPLVPGTEPIRLEMDL